MSKVLACVDGSVYANSVLDHAAWAAGRLQAGVEVLQVLGRRQTKSSDRSGRIVAGARRKLLEELAQLDAERAKLEHKEAWMALDEAKARLETAGVPDVSLSLRHGDLLESMHEREDSAALVVIGKRGEAADFASLHLGSNLERIVRSSRRPILIASRAFRPISRALVAFDGSQSALRAVDEIARSRLFLGIECLLLQVTDRAGAPGPAVQQAADRLGAAGLSVDTRVEPGKPEAVIGGVASSENIDLLVMGAYGHSRLRTLVIGSTTAALIRVCQVPVAVYR